MSNSEISLPMEIINKILIWRPKHPVAVIFKLFWDFPYEDIEYNNIDFVQQWRRDLAELQDINKGSYPDEEYAHTTEGYDYYDESTEFY